MAMCMCVFLKNSVSLISLQDRSQEETKPHLSKKEVMVFFTDKDQGSQEFIMKVSKKAFLKFGEKSLGICILNSLSLATTH